MSEILIGAPAGDGWSALLVFWSVNAAFFMIVAGFLLTIVRLLRGPSLPDRVMALDLLTMLGICFIALAALALREWPLLDVAIGLALVGFLATVALARYVMRRSERS